MKRFERNEYPRPQLKRERWQSLNGEWEFEFDDANDGMSRGVDTGKVPLKTKINVPFSYQWEASGIFDRAVHDTVWYRRKFTVGKENAEKRALLCFNAADYETDVWINGKHAIAHTGGFTPFQADVTPYLNGGENTVVVRCRDSLDTAVPRGKQSWTGKPFGCFYYANTGLWGSVWLDFFGEDCIADYRLQTDIDNRLVCGEIGTLYGLADEAEIALSFQGKPLKKARISLDGERSVFSVALTGLAFDFGDLLWSVEKPNLIYATVTLYRNGAVCDRADTRFGMRKISVDECGNICLNNRPLYQRLILDQGYWKESGLTPPSAESLRKDIELAQAMGFNGARKHQKLEDPYFYYYAEELGFLVWCEMPSAYTFCGREAAAITKEWQEIVSVAGNYTSVVCYVPLNESWGVREIGTDKAQQNFAKSLYYLTKSLDATRLVSTNDGFETVEESDILGVHDYNILTEEAFPEKYRGVYDGMYPQGWRLFAEGHRYKGQPVLMTEFGGIAFKSEEKDGAWGYNDGAKDADELCDRLTGLMNGITRSAFQGYCYTKLTDVEQEVNGLLYADRTPKADLKRLKKIFANR